MDIALEDIKYKNSLIKIEELEKKLDSIYQKLQSKDNEHLQFVIKNYENYMNVNKQINEKKREAFENILEHLESLNLDDKKEIKLVSKELKKLF